MAWSWASEYGDPSRKPGVPRRADDGGGNPLHEQVMQLQATAGNAAVQQMIQQDAARANAGGDAGKTGDSKQPAKPEILRYGSRGEAVRRLQEALNQYGGVSQLEVDGIMGALTTATLREFQKLHPPLDVDGTAGPEVWAELERVGNEGAPMAGASARDFFEKGRKLYAKDKWSLAYDEFAKAYQLNPDRAYLFNMAKAMALIGGRRDDAIKLYERFLASGPSEGDADTARQELEKLRGPSPTGDQAKNKAAALELHESGKKFLLDNQYGRAYDEFTKAYALTQDPAFLWNRGVALRSMGGQRGQAIALFEQLLGTDVSEDRKAAARQEILELRGPGPSGDTQKDKTTEKEIYLDAQVAFHSEDYAVAYDLFTKGWEIRHDASMLWNRAQALRLMGGRREEAIKLYQQFLALDVPAEIKKAARVHVAELQGPTRDVADLRH